MTVKKPKQDLRRLAPYYAKMVPATWLDPLLTGEKAVIGKPPYNCKDIERLLQHIADRISRSKRASPAHSKSEGEAT